MIAGVCEMAAGMAPPTATPTTITEFEEDTSEDFLTTFSAPTETEKDTQQPSQVTLKPHGEGEGMEMLEADFLAQETEDRLTQLMLDDELSDARLLGLGAEPGSEQPLPHVESFTSSVSASQTVSTKERTVPTQNSILHSGEVGNKTTRGSQEQLDHRGSKSVVLTTHQELTLDVREKERLEDSLIIAG